MCAREIPIQVLGILEIQEEMEEEEMDEEEKEKKKVQMKEEYRLDDKCRKIDIKSSQTQGIIYPPNYFIVNRESP